MAAVIRHEVASEMKTKAGLRTPDGIEKATAGGTPGLAPRFANGGCPKPWVKVRQISPFLENSDGKSLLEWSCNQPFYPVLVLPAAKARMMEEDL